MTDIVASNALGENVQANSIIEAKYMIQQVDAVGLEPICIKSKNLSNVLEKQEKK